MCCSLEPGHEGVFETVVIQDARCPECLRSVLWSARPRRAVRSSAQPAVHVQHNPQGLSPTYELSDERISGLRTPHSGHGD